MGARQSKRSVDITTSPKKGEIDGSQPIDGRLEKIEDGDKTANGSSRGAEQEVQEVVMNGSETIVDDDLEKVDKSEKLQAAGGDASVDASGPEENMKSEEQVNESQEKDVEVSVKKDKEEKKEKEKKEKDKDKKDKVKKKWSFRNLGMSRKEKSKPREETSKNGDVTKEEAEPEEGADKKVPAAADVPSAITEEKMSEKNNAENIFPATSATADTPTEQTPGSADPSTAPLTPSTVQATPDSAEIKTAIPDDNESASATTVAAAAAAVTSPIALSPSTAKSAPEPELSAETNSKASLKIEESLEPNAAASAPEATFAAKPVAEIPPPPQLQSSALVEDAVAASQPSSVESSAIPSVDVSKSVVLPSPQIPTPSEVSTLNAGNPPTALEPAPVTPELPSVPAVPSELPPVLIAPTDLPPAPAAPSQLPPVPAVPSDLPPVPSELPPAPVASPDISSIPSSELPTTSPASPLPPVAPSDLPSSLFESASQIVETDPPQTVIESPKIAEVDAAKNRQSETSPIIDTLEAVSPGTVQDTAAGTEPSVAVAPVGPAPTAEGTKVEQTTEVLPPASELAVADAQTPAEVIPAPTPESAPSPPVVEAATTEEIAVESAASLSAADAPDTPKAVKESAPAVTSDVIPETASNVATDTTAQPIANADLSAEAEKQEVAEIPTATDAPTKSPVEE